jgi:hypothetical protein
MPQMTSDEHCALLERNRVRVSSSKIDSDPSPPPAAGKGAPPAPPPRAQKRDDDAAAQWQ